MRRRTLLTLLFAFTAPSLALWDFAPRTSSHNEPLEVRSLKNKSTNSATSWASEIGRTQQAASQKQNPVWLSSEELEPAADDDPDLPPGLSGKIDKQAYLQARG